MSSLAYLLKSCMHARSMMYAVTRVLLAVLRQHWQNFAAIRNIIKAKGLNVYMIYCAFVIHQLRLKIVF